MIKITFISSLKKNEPVQVFKRVGDKMIVKGNAMDVGHPDNPIEKEVYNKTKVYPTKIK